ncbi:TonB-dependent receptor [Phragmitibacter flavus]|nr:TonB-dependent receptor [Phragmitibacter flavus]
MHFPLAMAAGCCLFQAAAAEPNFSTTEIEPVVVTATRSATPLAEVPYTVHLIDQERVTEMAPQSFPEALKEIPGVFIQQTSHGQGSPYLRGFTGFRTLTMIDGIRLNNSVFRDGPNQYLSTIDVLSLRGIEVVKSQGSVLYGSDAIGGVINALTKGPVYRAPDPLAITPVAKGAKNVQPTAPAPLAGGPYITGLMSTRYATAEDSWTGRLEGSISEYEKYGFYLGLTGRTFGDLRAAGVGRLPETGYDELGLDAKLELFLADNVKLTIAHNQMVQEDVWRTHRTIFAVPYEGSSIGNEREHYFDQHRHLSYVRLEGTPDNGWLDRWQATLSYQRQSEDIHRTAADRSSRIDGFDADTFGFDLQFESGTAMGDLTYGVSYYLDKVDSFSDRFRADGSFNRSAIQGPVGDDSDYHLGSAFLQDVIKLNDRLELTLGARYTYAKAEVGKAEDPISGEEVSFDDDWNDVSGNARLLFGVDEEKHLKLFTGVSQSFRAPNLSDVSRLDSARSNELETAAPGLDPEKFLTGEIGMRWDSETVSAGLAYFYTDVKDMIVRAPTGRIVDGLDEVTKLNAGDGYIQGIEFDLSWQFHPQWRVFGSVAWQDGKVEGFPNSTTERVEEPVSRLLPLSGLVGLRWDSPAERFWVEGTVLMVDRQDRLNAGDRADTQRIPPGGTPGYTVATLRSGWRVTDAFTLTAAVENLSDEAYRVHGSGVNEPGVNFVFGAEVRF